mmetsp:Transcript_42052/g.107520  ORF Transcript_42052/g.107520 Transcript_42052/m.107520 type:complete len:285 (+) Transcript_42052:533-1387(+)
MPATMPAADNRAMATTARRDMGVEAREAVASLYDEWPTLFQAGSPARPSPGLTWRDTAPPSPRFRRPQPPPLPLPLEPRDPTARAGQPPSRAAGSVVKESPSSTGDERALAFELVQTDGGEFSRDYCCRNMLRKDGSCYSSTKREGIHVVVEMQGPPYFTLTDVEAIAPAEGYTSPLGQAVIFVSWDLPRASETVGFDLVYDKADYDAAVLRHEQRGGSHLVPIAFLDLEDRFHVQQHLPIPRAGRYVLIKMLRAQRAGENVDVQYIGFRGWTAPHAFEEGVLL